MTVWTAAEDSVLKANHALGLARCYKLLPLKTPGSIRQRARRLGLSSNTRWTPEEDQLLRAIYPDLLVLKAKLPLRTKFALRHRAGALGLQKVRNRWTGAEEQRLKTYSASMSRQEACAMFPGRPPEDVSVRMVKLGLLTKHKHHNPTGIPLLDQIRQRCFDSKIPYKVLGRAAGNAFALYGKSYKYTDHIQTATIGRAVDLLGGEFYAEWED